jgi:hypothetical protein
MFHPTLQQRRLNSYNLKEVETGTYFISKYNFLNVLLTLL